MPKILFEPWGLGDAIMASAIARTNPQEFTVACKPHCADLIKYSLPKEQCPRFLEIDYDHAKRNGNFLKAYRNATPLSSQIDGEPISALLTVTGDPRDYLLAKKAFPNIPIKISGKFSYFARRSSIFDLVFTSGLLKVKNRYKRWCQTTGVTFDDVKKNYWAMDCLSTERTCIHVGALWKVRQYPFVRELKRLLQNEGSIVTLAAGPNDPLPAGVAEGEVTRLTGTALVDVFKSSTLVVANDSGPMHLAAFLGLPTACIALPANFDEWIPPSVIAITSEKMPKGCRSPFYKTDLVLEGWTPPETVLAKIKEYCRG